MKSERHNSTKYLPGITTRKPQLRSNSWAKPLSQNRSTKAGEHVREVSGMDLTCTPVLFNTKVTMKRCQNSFENLVNYIGERGENTINTVDEMQQIEESEISEKSDKDEEDSSDTASRFLDDVTKVSRTKFDNEKIELDHLPPLAHTATAKSGRKIPNDKFYTRIDSKGRSDSPQLSNTARDIDWQNIFVNGGFRPHESRDLPTRGELILLKYKTWDSDDPVYCVRKCAKYFGLDNPEIDLEKGHLTPTEKELRKRYTSSLSPNFKFYPTQVSKRYKAFAPLGSYPEALTYLESPAKRSTLCNYCVVPPVTPASSMVRSSPFGLSPLPYKDRIKNTLGELTEISLDGPNTDEGTASPTDSELEF